MRIQRKEIIIEPSKPEDRIDYANFPPEEREFYEYLDKEWRNGRRKTDERY